MKEIYWENIDTLDLEKIELQFRETQKKESNIIKLLSSKIEDSKYNYSESELQMPQNQGYQQADFNTFSETTNYNLIWLRQALEQDPDNLYLKQDYIRYISKLESLANQETKWLFHDETKQIIKINKQIYDKIDLTYKIKDVVDKSTQNILIATKSTLQCLWEEFDMECINKDYYERKIKNIQKEFKHSIDSQEAINIAKAAAEFTGEFIGEKAYERLWWKIIETVISKCIPKNVIQEYSDDIFITTADYLNFWSIETFVTEVIKLWMQSSGIIEIAHDETKQIIAKIDLDEIKFQIKNEVNKLTN